MGCVFSTTVWFCNKWGEMSVDELLYHLNTSIKGSSRDMILSWICSVMLSILIISLYFILIYKFCKKHNKLFNLLYIFTFIFFFLGSVIVLNSKMNIIKWLRNRNSTTEFIKDNYVDPESVDIMFPDKKRNLIYIYIESMELSYADSNVGGYGKENYIPELTKLGLENECFSENKTQLNGFYSVYGTEWTVAAMFGTVSGLPLKEEIRNNMNTQNSFASSVTCLGDILEREGYTNEIIMGSDASFGGRNMLFKQHGNYKVFDYYYAIENGYLQEDYFEWWGYEDEKLFEYAKNELLELSSQKKPFNFSLLTADTHFEDGFVCEKCNNDYDNQYANVIACSSKQVFGFVEWITQQDFYDNTTIIISGDHPTMDKDYSDAISKDYARKVYTVIINSPIKGGDIQREYSTFDMFPTTLAALGVEIEGDRLGLGVNVFSDKETLIELYGIDKLNDELMRKSEFLDDIFNVQYKSETILKLLDDDVVHIELSEFEREEEKKLRVLFVSTIDINNIDECDGFRLMIYDSNKQESTLVFEDYMILRGGDSKGHVLYYKVTSIDTDSLTDDLYLFQIHLKVNGVDYIVCEQEFQNVYQLINDF